LVSPDFPAVAKFGQPSIETSEPCGKRGFVKRFIATSSSALVRAIRHFGDPTRCLWKWKLRPVALESRADHTDHPKPSQDSVLVHYLIDLLNIFLAVRHRGNAFAALQQLILIAAGC
jgi:hypothetical protein